MTLETLISTLETAKFDVYLNEAPNGTSCPYLVVQDLEHPNFFADNRTFAKTTAVRLRLVESEVHDWSLIATLEQTLDSLSLPYSSNDAALPGEHVCESYYDINFYGGIKNA